MRPDVKVRHLMKIIVGVSVVVLALPQARAVLRVRPRVRVRHQVHLRAHLVPAAVVVRVVRQARHLLQVARQVVVHRAVLPQVQAVVVPRLPVRQVVEYPAKQMKIV